MERWEYSAIKMLTKGFAGGILDMQNFDTELNRMGAEGWELVSCFDTNQSYGQTREVVSVFKRKMST